MILMTGKPDSAFAGLAFVALAVVPLSTAFAQELVPAAYTPAPYGINLVTAAAVYNSGDLAFDPAGPIEDASAEIFVSSFGYARTFGVAGRAANIGVFVPYVLGEVEGIYLGEQAFAERSGIGDVGVRAAVNLFGAPAMSPKEFSAFRPRNLIGVSLTVSMDLRRGHSLRVAASRGAITRIGGDFASFGVSYGYSWMGQK